MRLHTSAGSIDTHSKGKFGGFDVWFNPTCLANILSLALVMDTATANSFNVHILEGHVIKFSLIRPGLYLLDTTVVDIHKLRQSFSFFNTVDQNKKHFGKREVRKADEALLLHRKSNHVAKDKFLRIVKNNLICNNPVNRRCKKVTSNLWPSYPSPKRTN